VALQAELFGYDEGDDRDDGEDEESNEGQLQGNGMGMHGRAIAGVEEGGDGAKHSSDSGSGSAFRTNVHPGPMPVPPGNRTAPGRGGLYDDVPLGFSEYDGAGDSHREQLPTDPAAAANQLRPQQRAYTVVTRRASEVSDHIRRTA